MQRSDFAYDLPPDLIAQHPLAERTGSRLLYMSAAGGPPADLRFGDIENLLRPGDLLVANDTRVVPARMFGHKASGGRVEVMLERLLDDQQALAQLRVSKKPAPGSEILLEQGGRLEILKRDAEGFFILRAVGETLPVLLEREGQLPLPPYIERAPATADLERYQTVYARTPGAVAAPTAGLHFDPPLLAALAARGIGLAHITLHVGAGTFSPVRVDNLAQHRMHTERLEVSAEVCERVAKTRAAGGRVIAVGTTSVRALETAAAEGELKPYAGETAMFITPGYRFRVVDALITNFHLPESTLLMLVCAFGGYESVMAAYRHAVAQRYRFFSYGDAMFIECADAHASTNTP
ncbi:MAG: tRNA preQ1(34) S-adenosylmethionine ribosyltransferase-isomerase QueA [Gammaproteobacteria bacterium]|nr:tRNA preQ1(34) S-adenosylmethionine ribosyltransferase-isomerase QueA [Gammaproteobacteria bacterium]